MQIALYSSHHYLPFCHAPRNPELMFYDRALSECLCHYTDYNDLIGGRTPAKKTMRADAHWIWSVLLGLHRLEIPGLLAHVSFGFDLEKKLMRCPPRVWVQITTLPMEKNEKGIPLVVGEHHNVLVEHLWGGDNGNSYDPYGLLSQELKERIREREEGVHADISPEFWTDFFLERLKATRDEFREQARKFQALEALYVNIPP